MELSQASQMMALWYGGPRPFRGPRPLEPEAADRQESLAEAAFTAPPLARWSLYR
jgi:hypothetical protein